MVFFDAFKKYVCIVNFIYFSIGVFTSYFDIVGKLLVNYPNVDFLLLGDFNQPSANFCNAKSVFFNNQSYLNFKQINNVLNKNNILLDYVITNSNSCTVLLNNLPIINIDLHYPPLVINYSSHNHYNNSVTQYETMYIWNKADYKQITSKIGNMNWNSIYENNDINSNISLFYSNISTVINDFVPTFRLCNHSNSSIWFSYELKYII
jgi:hypothetical protein